MGIKPMGRNSVKPALSSKQIGSCTECKAGIWAHEKWVRIRRPSTGMCHLEHVPPGATLAEAAR